MRTNRKMISILLAVALVAALAAACGSTPTYSSGTGDETQASLPVEEGAEEVPDDEPAPEDSEEPAPTPALADQQNEAGDFTGKTLTFKFYDVESDEVKDAEVDMPADAPLSFPLQAVAEQMFGLPLEKSILKANSVAQKDDSVYIDFTRGLLDANAGSMSETAVLDAVAAVYLDNVDGVQKVYISVDGEDYSSGHIEFSKDEPYKEKA